jgi:hypothetical protein
MKEANWKKKKKKNLGSHLQLIVMDHINISKMGAKTRELLRKFALIFFSGEFHSFVNSF